MLTEKEIKKKLFEQGEKFKIMMRNKQYAAAKYCYQSAFCTAMLVELDQKDRDRLFGVRGERGAVLQEGCFPIELVIRMEEMVDVRGYGDQGKGMKRQ